MRLETLGFIGAGNMAEALWRGLLETKTYAAKNLFAFDIKASRLDYVRSHFGIKTANELPELIREADVLLLAVKPQQAAAVLQSLRSLLVSERHILISIVAGLPTTYLEKCLGHSTRIVRVMPNTPAQLRAGATAYCLGQFAGETEQKLTEKIFSAVGLTVKVQEAQMNAVTALSGSGPAYVFRLCEVMTAAGKDMGLPAEIVQALVVQTILGAARMLAETGRTAAELRTLVTSPGGTTEAALKHLDTADFPGLFREALRQARERAQALTPPDPDDI